MKLHIQWPFMKTLYCAKQATIHQVTIMLATSKNVLFPGHNHLLTTGINNLTLWLSPKRQWDLEIGHFEKWLAWWLRGWQWLFCTTGIKNGLEVSTLFTWYLSWVSAKCQCVTLSVSRKWGLYKARDRDIYHEGSWPYSSTFCKESVLGYN